MAAYFSWRIHFIWSAANREPLILLPWRNELYRYIGGILEYKGAKLLNAGGMADHGHLYASLPATLSVAEAVNAMKANSSRWIHEQFSGSKHFAWQTKCGVQHQQVW